MRSGPGRLRRQFLKTAATSVLTAGVGLSRTASQNRHGAQMRCTKSSLSAPVWQA